MESNSILNADVLDIIFDGRNKQYGAYELRKTYNKRLTIALAVMFSACLLAVVGTVLASNGKPAKKTQVLVTDISLAAVEEKKNDPPPVQPPKEKPQVKTIQSTPPKIVQEEVKNPPPTQADQDDVKIGTANIEGIKSDVVAPPVEEKSTGPVAAPKGEEDFDKEFKTVQIQAQFPGGMEEWAKYLKRNLRAEVGAENGAPAGRYPVIVSFLVDKQGNVSEVKAENDPGYGMATEAVRVIQRSGKWIPAIQNGRNVIFRQKQSVIFVIDDGQ
ncbi:MAG TPA: energy transducer TonB [Chitinophagaceae bacterium]|nr:energy transducer TonB [Chitinophagaceae bacterium]